jgi:2-oxoglutarate dehydrogenase E1 component
MGFEYGYSSVNPHRMVIWEAQFGDFSNGAQIIIDQYLAVGETKWQRMNGLILMLPHGYEGQGPEHSSARIERYLELCANKNMQIINCTTPANYFHALRMQFKRDFRIPIIFFTPKKLLRYPACVSSLSEFTQGGFQELIDDAYVQKPADVKRVLLCNGKIYYDLFEKQQELQRQDVAIVRLEQLYPLPIEQLREVQAKYKNAEFYWVQEEPRNMGAWGYMLRVVTELPLQVIARTPSPSPATGFSKEHTAQQENLVNLAFGLVKPEKVVRYDIRSSKK